MRAGDAVKEQQPGAMIDLVLDRARFEPIGLDADLVRRMLAPAPPR